MTPFLSPNVRAIMPSTGTPQRDRAPDALAAGTPAGLRDDLVALLGADCVLARPIDLIRYATDASPYRLFPKAVVIARNVDDVRKVLDYARQQHESVTFRAAGTSLSGQAQGDGILVDVRRHWAGVNVEAGGRRLRARPGTILSRANLALLAHGYRLGPDPASASACTIGGVIANNSSGMCCGTTQNSYKTLSSLKFMLPSGTFIDSAGEDAERHFAAAEPALAAGLMEIKRDIESDPKLVARLRKKFSIKNTTGYHMEAFLDGATSLEIFRRLIVGSEGTLAFIAEAVFETIADDQCRLTSFMIFPDMYAACAAVKPFVDHGAAAVELVDRASLRAIEGKPGVPDRWKALPEQATALLVEFRTANDAARSEAERIANATLAGLTLLEPAAFTRDPVLAAQFWNVRSGLLASVGGARPSGSSFILEDVCFPQERLADGALDLQALFARHGYTGIVFGHASAGNLHFLITPFLNEAKEIAHYGAFLHDVVELVVGKYDGSLKAEHGTGRNIAPYVEREWGNKLTALMWKLKRLADPQNILSPGVMLTADPESHLENLQTAPTIEPTVDRCIQCGFCEPVCPSRNLTTTPRQRIALRREMARQTAGSKVSAGILADYDYDAIQTCAGDGSCGIACPVDINTGALMKHFRQLERGPRAERLAAAFARRFGTVERVARLAVGAADVTAKVFGKRTVTAVTDMARVFVSKDLVPGWLPNMPAAAKPELPATSRDGAAGVYFTACVNRVFGRVAGQDHKPSLQEAMIAVSARAGMPLWIPTDVGGHCCATIWHSKGYAEGNAVMANRTAQSLWRWSDGGRLPIVCDASSCSLGLSSEIVAYLTPENRKHHAQLTILDSIAWAHDRLLPKLAIWRKVASAVLHPSCSVNHLKLATKLQALTAAMADDAVTPAAHGCCGFAGDRGFLHPELTRSATAEEAEEVRVRMFDAYLCSNRTCEIGLNLATGKDYVSFVYLLEELTRPT
ncbi:MAG: FAD-binding and (Fe-S)-binding domain-containing protein [Xanthobacteraceae bacterium]|jgi:D-lactate dehydrogenase